MFKANRNRQWAILSLVIFYIHAAPIHERRKVHHCVEMRCRPDIFDSVTTRLRSSAEVEEECRVCHTCANHGYSVCLHLPRSTLAPFGAKSRNGSSCACAFSVPESCNFPSDSSEESESLHPVDVCFRSALRIPPRPRVVGTKRTVILTVDELWNDPYWKDLDISNLKIHYEFPVAVSEYCDGTVKSTSNDNQLVCSATLNIDLYDYTSGSDDATDGAVKSDNLKERVDYESLPPEIRFDRNVFLGAESVCFWYTVAIRRPRQIEFEIVGHGELNGARLVDINTTTTSTKLTFDLEPQIYGTPEYYDDEEATDSNGLKHTTSKSQTVSEARHSRIYS
ncbi:hypothetical protein AB6A40_007064 [Gnathostoma spinigerum]|uniref:Uncharacterized protein n=1 Tax=Gnathostoma spinigerum TaxID=75299 RepID=A0ABD6EVS4_9BILA